jgi:choline dehydrogenase
LDHVIPFVFLVLADIAKGKMSSGNDAVVRPDLSVVGVQRLRVIDASIMPTTPNANTNAPTMVIASRGAQFIIEKWSK